MTPVIAVVGATASGKTSLALELAEHFNTEILSADSMQVYRGMEIGAATATTDEQARAPHHFISILEPTAHFSAAEFADQGRAIIERLNAAGKPAIVAGGSGLYVRALLDGLMEGPSRDDAFREQLREEAQRIGVPALYARLQSVDPIFAATIHPNDMRRIERGLEVYEATGEPLSALHARHQETVETIPAIRVAIDMPRELLYERINARVWHMVELGFVEEVQRLIDAGHGPDIERLRSRGHPEMAAHIRGECSLEDAVTLIQRNTRHLAKRQLSWFRGDDQVQWLPAENAIESIFHLLKE